MEIFLLFDGSMQYTFRTSELLLPHRMILRARPLLGFLHLRRMQYSRRNDSRNEQVMSVFPLPHQTDREIDSSSYTQRIMLRTFIDHIKNDNFKRSQIKYFVKRLQIYPSSTDLSVDSITIMLRIIRQLAELYRYGYYGEQSSPRKVRKVGGLDYGNLWKL